VRLPESAMKPDSFNRHPQSLTVEVRRLIVEAQSINDEVREVHG